MASQASNDKRSQKGIIIFVHALKFVYFLENMFDVSLCKCIQSKYILTYDEYVCFYPTEIGDIAGAAEVTIKQSYKLMYPKAHALFPEDFVFDTPIEQLPPNWETRSA